MRFSAHLRSLVNMNGKIEPQLSKQYLPPKFHDGKLAKKRFSRKINLVALAFKDPRDLGKITKLAHRRDLLNVRSILSITKDSGNSGKLIILKDSVKSVEDINKELSNVTLDYLKSREGQYEAKPYVLDLNYDFWKADEILASVLPENLGDEIPTSFTTVGHVAHLNLKENYLPYKHIIGEVILDKNPRLRTVVTKTETIATEFRTFPMEVIGGDSDLDVVHHELGCEFRFNFQDVYWNSRLQTEHSRLIGIFKPGEVIFDVMAGVGPFAIPAAKKKSIVFANDLNPASYKYLVSNAILNRTGDFSKCYNLDGNKFIKESPTTLMEFQKANPELTYKLPGSRLSKQAKKQPSVVNVVTPKFVKHYVMNLPDSAIEFLPAFIGVFNNSEYRQFTAQAEFELPDIHVYCFQNFLSDEQPTIEELQQKVHYRIVEQLKYEIPYADISFHLVRKVAPNKIMFCASFQLPEKVAFA